MRAIFQRAAGKSSAALPDKATFVVNMKASSKNAELGLFSVLGRRASPRANAKFRGDEKQDYIDSVFAEYDTNGDDCLDPEEINRYLSELYG